MHVRPISKTSEYGQSPYQETPDQEKLMQNSENAALRK